MQPTHMPRSILCALGLILFVSMTGATLVASEEPRMEMTSVVSLLSNPVRYEGSLIGLKGYFGGGRTTVFPALFLSQDHAEIDDISSSFSLMNQTGGFIEKHCRGHYVYLEAKFVRQSGPENRGSDPGMFAIADVTKLEIYRDGKRYPCWPAQATQN